MKKYVLSISSFFAVFSAFSQSTLNRPNAPVIVSGSGFSSTDSLLPAEMVGFKFAGGTWTQIPVQVDERALLDVVTPYGSLAGGSGYMAPAPSASNPKIYFYCDPNTNVGADFDTLFDSDDELVFMAKDAGGQFSGTNFPSGTVAGFCRQISINDPLGGTGYIYLFKNDGTLQQNAGVHYVSLTSNLLSTSLFPAHTVSGGTNVENTTVSTAKYAWHFASEWVSDSLKIFLGTGVDILDRDKAFFANGGAGSAGCGRNEDLFSSGENAFIVAKAGAIRVLRSYMGAQSGPLTQRTHLFYEGYQTMITNLRVHAIPSIYDAFDYEPAANGMIYRNSLNTTGVTIDGQPDNVAAGLPTWEQVTGAQGTLSLIGRYSTTFSAAEAAISNYYDDNSANPASNCTGSNGAWGTSGYGIVFNGSFCTDCPTAGNFRTLELSKHIFVDSASLTSSAAENYSNQIDNPLQTAVAAITTATDSFTVSLSTNPIGIGYTNGAGTYPAGATVTVSADAVFTAEETCEVINWTENGAVVATSQAYQFTITANRNLVANYDCPTGIAENERANVRLYPNPTSGNVTIVRENTTLPCTVKVFDMLGKSIKNAEFSTSTYSFSLENSGVYQVVISDKNATAVRKIIVAK